MSPLTSTAVRYAKNLLEVLRRPETRSQAQAVLRSEEMRTLLTTIRGSISGGSTPGGSGEDSNGPDSGAQTGSAQTGSAQPGSAQTGSAQPGSAPTGNSATSSGQDGGTEDGEDSAVPTPAEVFGDADGSDAAAPKLTGRARRRAARQRRGA